MIFKHRDVALICVTGGPAVARAALNSGKRAIVAGPGNPPVVVDETADLDRAAAAIMQGGSYDNNLLCIAEKEVFVVDQVFDAMLHAMERAGAVRLNAAEVDRLTAAAIVQAGEGGARHDVPCKDLLGKDAAVLAQAAGRTVPRRNPTAVRRNRRVESVRVGRADDALPALRPLPRRGRGDRQGQTLGTWVPAHQHHPLQQRPQHDPHGPHHGHHPVRQERSLHGRPRAGRRRLPLVLHRRADRRRSHHAADIHPRTPLLDDRRPVDSGQTEVIEGGPAHDYVLLNLRIATNDPCN